MRDLRPDLSLDSAGTAGWHVGKAPYGPMQGAAREQGIDMSDLRARQLSASDFTEFDLIVGMDAENIQDINALRPGNATAQVALFSSFAGENGPVPDPYYTRDFDGALELIKRYASALSDQV